jgi:hypothetical protein
MVKKKYYLKNIEFYVNKNGVRRKMIKILNENNETVYTSYNREELDDGFVVFCCLSRFAESVDFSEDIREGGEVDFFINEELDKGLRGESGKIESLFDERWGNWNWKRNYRVDVNIILYQVSDKESARIVYFYSITPSKYFYDDRRRFEEESKWMQHDLDSITKKVSLENYCESCNKRTKYWITYNSYVNYWKHIMDRNYKYGDDDFSEGRYECLDCHYCRTDFYLGEENFELVLKSIRIKKLVTKNGDSCFEIINVNKIKDKGIFYCFKEKIDEKSWKVLSENFNTIREVKLLCCFSDYGEKLTVKKVLDYELWKDEELDLIHERTIAKKQKNAPTKILSLNLIPSTSWWKNARSEIPKSEWDRVRKQVYQKANYTCEICGVKSERLDCNELWEYKGNEQILIGLEAICRNCHLTQHMGYASISGKGQQALEHLLKVNKWTPEQGQKYVLEKFSEWGERSKKKWTLNLDYLVREYHIVFKNKKPKPSKKDEYETMIDEVFTKISLKK